MADLDAPSEVTDWRSVAVLVAAVTAGAFAQSAG